MIERQNIQKRYEILKEERQPYLDRARTAAAFTIPSLVVEEGHTQHDALTEGYQSLGARGVKRLASKMLLALFPPSVPFFRLGLKPNAEVALAGSEQISGEVATTLARIENDAMSLFESTRLRSKLSESLLHSLVAGTGLLYLPEDGRFDRFFPLSSFVLVRDGNGNEAEIITHERVDVQSLEEDLRDLWVSQASSRSESEISAAPRPVADLWTRAHRVGPKEWVMYQELGTLEVPDSRVTKNEKTMPFIPVRFSDVAGESYGRGFVEELMGDLRSFEGLSQALVEGAANAARLVWMIRPGARTRMQEINAARNGQAVAGDPDDVSPLQMDKARDMQFVAATAQNIEARLAQAFLMTSSIQRAGERVTAEEIRTLAQDLEDALGGVYSVLADELQPRIVTRILSRGQNNGTLPRLPEGHIQAIVTTGLQALGRSQGFQRLRAGLLAAKETLDPSAVDEQVDMRRILTQFLTDAGVADVESYLRSKEEIQAEREEAQQAAALQTFGPPALDLAAQQAAQQPAA